MKITWNEALGLPECPYLRRWVIDFGPFAIRLHRWTGSDDQRYAHDHAWWFLTLVLIGGYIDIEEREDGAYYFDIVKAPTYRLRPSSHRHAVKLLEEGKATWTLLLTGRAARRWGFWVGGKLMKRDKYFIEKGHHPCDPTREEPVRIKPNGERA